MRETGFGERLACERGGWVRVGARAEWGEEWRSETRARLGVAHVYRSLRACRSARPIAQRLTVDSLQ